jgi:hypothetical protein
MIGFRLSEEEITLLEPVAKARGGSLHEVCREIVHQRLRSEHKPLADSAAAVERALAEGIARGEAGIRFKLEKEIAKAVEMASVEAWTSGQSSALAHVTVSCVMCNRPVEVDLRVGTLLRAKVAEVLAEESCHGGGCAAALETLAAKTGIPPRRLAREIYESNKTPSRSRGPLPPPGQL